MLFVVFSMLLILTACGLLAVFVAFPHGGHQLPGFAQVGETLNRLAHQVTERLPVLHETDADPDPAGDQARSAQPASRR